MILIVSVLFDHTNALNAREHSRGQLMLGNISNKFIRSTAR